MADEKAAEAVLGSLIRYKRQAMGLSQEQPAERLEVTFKDGNRRVVTILK